MPELKIESVRDAVRNTVAYLQGRLPRKVQIITSLPDDDPLLAPLNRYLFEWVIENLCKNAADAMDGAGTITIVASQDVRKIYLDISDTGRGMSPSVQRRIFDSGFTTKSRGWGLGLPLARRIVNQYHRGRLYRNIVSPAKAAPSASSFANSRPNYFFEEKNITNLCFFNRTIILPMRFHAGGVPFGRRY